MQELRIIPVTLSAEIRPDDSLASKLLDALRRRRLSLLKGDIVVVKHKVVSKAEGRLVRLDTVKTTAASRAWGKRYHVDARVIELALRESASVIRRKNGVLITETRHGFICANSGIDVSNVDGGEHALLLPEDPDRSARKLHGELRKLTGHSIPVIISDSFGRAWREGSDRGGHRRRRHARPARLPRAAAIRTAILCGSPSTPWPTSWRALPDCCRAS